ncbi:F-box/LRR-repeat protein 10 isoform X2 [Cryptomeria japonica]|uniref:F-box/LRR-repeat protein 10 isoform X2 n=1 Tax=Cryptomeria japonica TaxID=3369 RepID=UPI0027DAA8EB|nr:F-box/LRR-repeat protein 10 isoform X2 [Cryptomeria japonica]
MFGGDLSATLEMLQHLIPSNVALRSLKLDCAQLDDSSIKYLAIPQLEELSLQSCDSFTAGLLFEIGENCKKLRSLSIELGWIDDKPDILSYTAGLEQLLRGCSQLESLCLMFDGSPFDNRKFAAIWGLAAPTLKVLDLGYVLEKDVKEIFNLKNSHLSKSLLCHSTIQMKEDKNRVFPNLQKLCLALDWISDSLMGIISKNLPFLTHLDLRDEPVEEPYAAVDLTNWGIQQTSGCSRLRHLSLVRSQEFCPTSFKRVNDLGILLMAENCSNLESIRLGGFCRITDAGFRAILHACPNLQKLELLRTTQLTDLVFHDISATPLSLAHVSLRSCDLITDFSIINLVYCKNLQVLDLKGCRGVGDDALKAVSFLTKLKTLQLNSSDISDLGLSYLGSGNAPLVSLSLRSCPRVTHRGISSLVAGSLVQTLQNLDLSNIPNLTDNAIKALGKSGVQIVELRLRECPRITDTSIMVLASMQIPGQGYGCTLRLLDIYNSGGITELSFLWFKKPYFSRLRWLGIGLNLNGDIVDTLAKNRPLLRISQGHEIDRGRQDLSDGFFRHDIEEEDELEQWLRNEEDQNEDEDEIEQWLRVVDEVALPS